MPICTICNKSFKNTQGLRGHIYFVHSRINNQSQESATQLTEHSGYSPAAPAADEPRLSKLEHRLAMLEQATGVETEQLDDAYFRTEPLAEQVAKLTEQLKTLTSSSVSQAELTPVCDRLEGLSQQLSSLNFSYQSLFDEISTLEKELGEKADQRTVLSIEARIAKLEKAQTEYRKLAKALADSHTQSMQNIISIISKLAETVTYISNQVGEQKQVTDWIKKKFELVPVKA